MNARRWFSLCVSALASAAIAARSPLEFEEYPDGTPRKTAGSPAAAAADGSLPAETKLILGTLLLEGTGLAVDPQQAAVLLPLWRERHDLLRGDAPDSGERAELLAEIQAAMFEEQIRAIDSMELSEEDVAEFLEGIGPFLFQPSAGPEDGNPSPEPPQTPSMSPEELATRQAVFGAYRGGFRDPSSIPLQALLGLLEIRQGE